MTNDELGSDIFKDEIAKTAIRLIADRGPDGVSRIDVVKTMGLTKAAMDRHCPTESDLWLIVASLIEQRMKQAWAAIVAADTSRSKRLNSLLAVQVSLIAEMPFLRALLLSGSLNPKNGALRRGLCDVRQGFRALLVETLTEGKVAGEFPKELNVEVVADFIIETIQGMVVSWSLVQWPNHPVETILSKFDAFVSGQGDVERTPIIDHGPSESN